MPEPIDLAAIVNLHEFEPPAIARMRGPAYDYVAGGSWDELSLAEAVEAWRRFRFLPRVLADIREVDASGSFLGRRTSLPIAVAPMAAQAQAHPDAEAGMARAAAAAGVPMILSTSASMTPEAVAAAAPGGDLLYQLYLVKDLGYSREIVERAAAAGYRAIVLTVDLPVLAYRERDRRNGYVLPAMPVVDGGEGRQVRGRYSALEDQKAIGLTWPDLETVASWSGLPLVIKGVLAPDDARRAVDHGVAGIVVSNHGARQLDRSIAPVDALPAIVEAVGGRCEVWVDGGVRRGLDVAIALCLGATGVLVGRPFFWALAAGGEAGVARALAILREEFEIALPLLGVGSVGELGRSYLAASRP